MNVWNLRLLSLCLVAAVSIMPAGCKRQDSAATDTHTPAVESTPATTQARSETVQLVSDAYLFG